MMFGAMCTYQLFVIGKICRRITFCVELRFTETCVTVVSSDAFISVTVRFIRVLSHL